jgi:hypothetical protein
MKAETTKIELIQWLAAIEDKTLLSSLLSFKKANESLDWADQLSKKQLNEIKQGLDDVKKGKTTSSEKLWAAYGRKVKR